MILLNADALEKLIDTHPSLTKDRRRLLVEYITDLTPEDRDHYLEAYAEFSPAEEIVFIRACFGEQPLLTGKPL
jgi:hypothetical protein